MDNIASRPEQRAGHSGAAYLRPVVAYALVLLAPTAAWLAWVSWSDGKPSDAMHVAWFATVALACLAAGGLAPRGGLHLASLSLVAVASAIVILFLWWSGEDSSGLFLVGIILATPLLAVAAPILVLLGRWLTSARVSSAIG